MAHKSTLNVDTNACTDLVQQYWWGTPVCAVPAAGSYVPNAPQGFNSATVEPVWTLGQSAEINSAFEAA